ncbi:hypothetical protein BH18ACI2_BH18ACI2_23720 [soil metagenome]
METISLNILETVAPVKEEKRERGAGSESERAKRTGETSELGLWLLALNSFFILRHHSFSDAERRDFKERDFSNETSITQQALRRCLRLCASLPSAGEQIFAETSAPPAAKAERVNNLNTAGTLRSDQHLDALMQILNDGSCLCAAMHKAGRVSFQAWASFGRVLARELSGSESYAAYARLASEPARGSDYAELSALTWRITPETLGADMSAIFAKLVLLLERLQVIEALLRGDAAAKHSLPLFTLLHQDATALVELIEGRAMRSEELPEEIFDALDRTAYALGMELCKVFSHELVGLARSRQAPVIYSKVENAHGLLRDCFQQSLVALAQIFDPEIEGAHLFGGFQAKLEQSLALRNDLWMLLQLVQRAAKEEGHRPIGPLLEHLHSFQRGSLRYLMYKDWETYERFVSEIATARGGVELTPIYHRLGTYLETLFGQINMRAVLADQPFDYPQLAG